MQALSDEQRIDLLEKKIDAGFARVDQRFAEMRSEIKSSERGSAARSCLPAATGVLISAL